MSVFRVLAGFGFGLASTLALAQTQTPVPHARAATGYALIDTHNGVPAMPPPTPRHDVAETYFGTAMHDPYRWLEDANAPAVKEWIAAQNTYTEKMMEGFPDAKAIARRVGELALTSTEQFDPKIVGATLFYLRQTPPQPQAALVAQAWPQGKARVLVDPNTAQGGVAITGYWPSPDGKYVAYGTAEGGNEETTIHFIDVATGRILPDALPQAGGGTTPQALVWDPDGKGVTYARLPLPGTVPKDQLQFNAALYHHVLGSDAKRDTLEFGKGLSRVAEYTLLGSADGRHAAALLHYGDGAPDAVYLRNGNGPWKLALGTDANVRAASEINSGAAWDGDRLLVVAYQGAPRGKLLALDANGGSKLLVPRLQGGWAMHSVAPVKGGLLITEVHGPDWRVQEYSRDGSFIRTVPLPKTGIGVGTIASSAASDRALISYSGWTIPSRWVEFDSEGGTLKTVFEVKPAADYSSVVTYRLDATSKDGTKVPVTVIAMKGITRNGARPTILYGYGGFDISTTPHFIGSNLAWLERGGVYAVANIRGGGEFGEGWHEAGMLGKKQNVFDDFYAAAQALVQHHWTDPAHLGILGGSNGGLLMGAALTQHPSEYRAVVSLVGIYDMLRVELWPNGPYNISEYGTVTKPADFQWLRAYSPLQNVKQGTAYPAVLLITGVNDPRVAPWQSRKFAAALQAATSSRNPILLLTRMNEGHGVTASFSQRVGNAAATLAFFAQELGLGQPLERAR
ncbi:MAG TPA: prolyl oligopeptidase family serine peptidase [Rhodanobacteraceae bacterium]|nr:prolyl oligopeptidase family serine peptidase [Rhodanobacteraceae bacterium]